MSNRTTLSKRSTLVRRAHLAALALATLACSLLAGGCSTPSVSDAAIDQYCQVQGTTMGEVLQECEDAMRRERDAADRLGCGTQFAAYFRCLDCPTADCYCPGQVTEIDICAMQNDPDNSCTRADQRLAACGAEPFFGVALPLCDGGAETWCQAQCILGADCAALGRTADVWPAIVPCVVQCMSTGQGLPSGDPGFPGL
jgi:hypothetical protein